MKWRSKDSFRLFPGLWVRLGDKSISLTFGGPGLSREDNLKMLKTELENDLRASPESEDALE